MSPGCAVKEFRPALIRPSASGKDLSREMNAESPPPAEGRLLVNFLLQGGGGLLRDEIGRQASGMQ